MKEITREDFYKQRSKRFWQNQKKQSSAGFDFSEQRERSCDYYAKALSKEFQTEVKTKYHIRINGVLDIYPKSRRYHDLKSNTRGFFDNVKDIRDLLTTTNSK